MLLKDVVVAGEHQPNTTTPRRTWLEVENENTSQSICGLEICFQSVPQVQHIDDRLLEQRFRNILYQYQFVRDAIGNLAVVRI